MSGGFSVLEDQLKAASAPGSWIADHHLGLTADRTRVVDYESTEAAFNFRGVGKKVTAEESARYGISPEHPYSPRPGETREFEQKQADPPENKAVERADVQDKSVGRRKKGR